MKLLLLILLVNFANSSRVLELSDRFLEIRKDGIWLVKFYAPWCGHCKKLEPIYNHVAQQLHDSQIRVGRVDCTRFPAVASEFGITGFPTIMFLKGPPPSLSHVFTGERTTEEIVNYAKRMAGPSYRTTTVLSDLTQSSVLFRGDKKSPLFAAFLNNSLEFQATMDFFVVLLAEKKSDFDGDLGDGISLYRDGAFIKYKPEEEENLNASLKQWINKERFPKYVKISRNNFQQILGTKKLIGMAVVEEDKLGNVNEKERRFLDALESVVDLFTSSSDGGGSGSGNFQFGWTGSPELGNSLAMTNLPLPTLLVINSTSFHHHLISSSTDDGEGGSEIDREQIIKFLESVRDGEAETHGGNTFRTRLYRTYYESRTSLVAMWAGNPVLTTLLFGLPFGFLSLICYSICCADILDSNNSEDELIDDYHEKNE